MNLMQEPENQIKQEKKCKQFRLIHRALNTSTLYQMPNLHSDPNSKKVSKKSDFVWKYISKASIYSLQVIVVHFCVKNSYLFIFIK